MTLTLSIDVARWREHQQAVVRHFPGLVPVCKGHGYGLGQLRIAQEAKRLGAGVIAVGTVREAAEIQHVFDGDIMVLTPGPAPDGVVLPSHRVLTTVATVTAARELAGARTVVKLRSAMRRHGITGQDLPALRGAMKHLRCEGFSLHFPINRPRPYRPETEAADWVDRLESAGLPVRTLFVSHLSADELSWLRHRHPGTDFRLRTGTRLWLGGRDVTEYRSTVLEVRPVAAGERFGTAQERARSKGHLVIVAGGTSHGIGLRAPQVLHGLRPRLRHLAGAIRAATDRHLSPFVHAGERRPFAEPPHPHESVLFLPDDLSPPASGDTLLAQVRYTTTRADRIVERTP